MSESNSDDSAIPNRSLTRSTTFPRDIIYTSAGRPRTTTTNSSSYFREQPENLLGAIKNPFTFSPKATTSSYSSAIRPGPSTVDVRKYIKDQAKYSVKPILNLKEIEEWESRFWLARSKLQYPLDMVLDRKIEYMDYSFFYLKQHILNVKCRKTVIKNFETLQEWIKELEDLSKYFVPNYSEDLQREAIGKEVEALKSRFLLAKNALKDQKFKAIKLKSDQDFIENCFRIIEDGFEESELEEIQGYIQKFEDDIEQDETSEDDADLIDFSSPSDPRDFAGDFD